MGDKAKLASEALGYDSVVRVDPNGFSKGIWVIWNMGTTKVAIREVQSQFILLDVEDGAGDYWACHVTYARPTAILCRDFWKSLYDFNRINTPIGSY